MYVCIDIFFNFDKPNTFRFFSLSEPYKNYYYVEKTHFSCPCWAMFVCI